MASGLILLRHERRSMTAYDPSFRPIPRTETAESALPRSGGKRIATAPTPEPMNAVNRP